MPAQPDERRLQLRRQPRGRTLRQTVGREELPLWQGGKDAPVLYVRDLIGARLQIGGVVR